MGGRRICWKIVGSKMSYRTPKRPGSEGGRQRVRGVCWESIGVQSFGRGGGQGQVELNEVMEFLFVHQSHDCPHVDGPTRKQSQEMVIARCWQAVLFVVWVRGMVLTGYQCS